VAVGYVYGCGERCREGGGPQSRLKVRERRSASEFYCTGASGWRRKFGKFGKAVQSGAIRCNNQRPLKIKILPRRRTTTHSPLHLRKDGRAFSDNDWHRIRGRPLSGGALSAELEQRFGSRLRHRSQPRC
jgi:hypothetical protein